ncbi:MAG: DUF4062 domain-containing protein [Roseburia sp.]
MKKKYQVFVSSTYEDLIDERKEVTQAILESGCFPSGMELFPASNKKQWDIIKQVIDDSDFYLLIIGGRYGSIGEDEFGKKIGFTEMEFDYAIKINKPIFALIHKNPELLPAKYVERTQRGINKLSNFIKKVKSNGTIKYWTNKDDLKSAVLKTLNDELVDTEAIGWTKGIDEQLESQIYYITNSEVGFEYIDLNNAKFYTHVDFVCLRNQMQYYTERFYWLYGGEMTVMPYNKDDILIDSFQDKNYIAYTNRLPSVLSQNSIGESGFIITVSNTKTLNTMFISNEPIFNHKEKIKLWVSIPDNMVFKKVTLKKYYSASDFTPYDEESIDCKNKKYIEIYIDGKEKKGQVFNLNWDVE